MYFVVHKPHLQVLYVFRKQSIRVKHGLPRVPLAWYFVTSIPVYRRRSSAPATVSWHHSHRSFKRDSRIRSPDTDLEQ